MTNQQGAPEAPTAAQIIARFEREDGYRLEGAVPREWALEAYNELRRLAALVAAQQPAPSAAVVVNPDPHAELRKTWQPGQRWQARSFRNGQWGPWTDAVASEPFWFPHQDYRRHPDDLAPQPSPTPQADSQPAAVLDSLLNIVINHEARATPEEVRSMAAELATYRAARAPADSVTAPAGGAAAGWQTVPVSPDEWMEGAGNEQLRLGKNAGDVWDAMLAAAPTPPAQAADSVLEDAARLLRQILAASQDGDSDTHLSAHFVSRIETITNPGGAA